ncbi:MAG: FAD/NAD(P)-binding protein [Candidatus Sumerlaeia bacterium]|nr:FAD/NAD(P)-binding protein [Candidatus Sumerlaeia bacterium]
MNPYLPLQTRIEIIRVETDDRMLRTFVVRFVRPDDAERFRYRPGQFAEVSLAGRGEVPIGIASSPTEGDALAFTINRAGIVTTAIHQLRPGDFLGVRGPLGNGFPIERLEGHNLVIIGGGFAFTTLRSLAVYAMAPHNRKRFGRLTVIYGARRPGLLLYRSELKEWQERGDIEVFVTVDAAEGEWSGRVGFVPAVTKDVAPASDNAYALVCGPPVMIKYTLPILSDLGFPPERILLSLEMRMKCGIGICGRCNIGPKYVCKDGPVFSLAELKKLPPEY